MEVGTSFGKNFLQVANACSKATLVGLDIENISPVLNSYLMNSQKINEWDTVKNSLKKNKSSFTRYQQKTNDNTVFYLSGDVFDENSWKNLEGMKFNTIFSDAFHTPEALLHEYKMLEKYDLIDSEEFIIVFDDLGGDMTTSFFKIFNNLYEKYNLHFNQRFIIPLRGWLGVNEDNHQVGFIVHLN